jgi:hypothetical protein
MHPLYDTHGVKGRQIFLPAGEGKERRLAFVHTLCAFIVGKHIGVYGCCADGFYDTNDQHCSILPTREPDNEDLLVEGEPTGIHHFAYWGWLHMVRNIISLSFEITLYCVLLFGCKTIFL